MQTKDKYTFDDLVEIMKILRSENGCPWDKEQNHESLNKYVIEEAYEVVDAVQYGGMKLADELGDLLLQIVFNAQIGKEEGTFNIDDVTTLVCQKMIRRHPHVFGDAVAKTADDVLTSWDEIKRVERDTKSYTETLTDIPKCLPALIRAYKVQHKAAKAGFDWDNIKGPFDKVKEEVTELEEAISNNDPVNVFKESGDMLFAMVNVVRFLEVNPELALNNTTEKFIKRFEYVESRTFQQGKKMEDMTLKELDEFWEEAKSAEKE